MKQTVRIKQTRWQQDQNILFAIRKTVFVDEQKVPVDLEVDEHDPVATHYLALDSNGIAIATARILDNGHIGRMAVLKPWRCQGIGGLLLERIIADATTHSLASVFLNAQLTAVTFYERFGFRPTGDVFIDAGIKHQAMRLLLTDQACQR